MNLIPWRNKRRGDVTGSDLGFPTVDRFRYEMDRMIDRFFREPWGAGGELFGALGTWAPQIDVSESDTGITIRAEVPGVDPKELDVSITGDVLTVSGEKKETKERKGENYYHAERHFGSFRRSVQLPASVDTEKVTAEHKDGVVTIQLKKLRAEPAKRIPVSVAKD